MRKYFLQILRLFYFVHYFAEPENGSGGSPVPANPTPDLKPTISGNDKIGDMGKLLSMGTDEVRKQIRDKSYAEFMQQKTKNGQLLAEGQIAISTKEHEEFQKIIKEKDELEKKKMYDQGEFEKLLKKSESEKVALENTLRKELQEKDNLMKVETGKLTQLNLDTQIKNKLYTIHAHNPSDLLKIIRHNVRYKDGVPANGIEIVDDSGNIMYSEEDKSKQLSLDSFMTKLVNDKPYNFDIKKLNSPALGQGVNASEMTNEQIQNMSKEDFAKISIVK